MALGFAAAFSILLQLELHKLAGVCPLMHAGSTLRELFDANTDERDGGALTLTHLYLLLGCALPVWADMAGTASAALAGTGGFQLMWRLSNGVGSCVAPFAGVLIIAIGDAMASVVGKNYGRLHWPGTKKTVEGTVAAAASVLVSALAIYGIMWHLPTVMRMGVSLDSLWPVMQVSELVGIIFATVLVCLLEAFTEQIDNLVLPVCFYSLLLIC
jgi:dolichol kinase